MEAKDCWKLAEAILCKQKSIRRIILHGPPGTGKTFAAVRSSGGRTVYSVTLTDDMSVAELIGHFVPRGQEFVWHDGPALRAWREGAVLVINEIDMAAGAVQTALLAILDDVEIARLTLITGETVTPHERFSVVATMNGSPDNLSDPLRDRFDVVLHINCPHPNAIKTLPESMRQVAVNSYSDPERIVPFRRFVAFKNLLAEGFETNDAAYLAFGSNAQDILQSIEIGVRPK